MDLNDHKQFEIAASITQSNSQTKSHFKILSNSINYLLISQCKQTDTRLFTFKKYLKSQIKHTRINTR
ncbi:hypothetical protein BpHYR1_015458 [Brachionus plicatilis]|uniref:Uncharacterized protein n=1 Tax=Brachionus plicatilis TaxID=10195 RepID=A0A3M7PTQ1_BRAPC|nr:hypothetical protein BpHYR1_015458 [Brachionus plicatilis]